MIREKVLTIVKNSICELNEELDYDSLRSPSQDTQVFGGEGSIDSLSLVRLVIGLESEIGTEFGTNIQLANEKAMSYRNSPFRTVGTLVEYITAKLEATYV